ncbi:siderophore-interacting protein [Actinoplanes sp. NPDC026619]|uniref:siderophore-interacting protein n=1 Tax=Actinoplanes sp. NPDC026619 TaxID=3155798 RepID=UPI003403BFEA
MTVRPRPAGPVVALTVLRLVRVAPRITRVVAGGSGLAQFRPSRFTDAYVRLIFPDRNARWPRRRTYTVRYLDLVAGEIAVDLVDHGRGGLAESWLATLQPGDPVLIQDVRGLYRPDADAGWHLLAGDEVALPAIARALESMSPGMRAKVLIEVADAADELPLRTEADVELRWIHRSRGDNLVQAVQDLAFDAGTVQAFVHGEGGAMHRLRRHLLRERGIDRDLLSVSGYWREGLSDEQWRAQKTTYFPTTPAAVPRAERSER